MKTLPDWVREWGEGLDAARELLRKRPDLNALAHHYGSMRVFDAEAAAKIKAALDARKKPTVVA